MSTKPREKNPKWQRVEQVREVFQVSDVKKQRQIREPDQERVPVSSCADGICTEHFTAKIASRHSRLSFSQFANYYGVCI